MIEIIFPQSSSPSYIEAVRIAKASKEYRQEGEGHGLIHIARFELIRDQILLASDLINLVYRLHGVRVKINGHPIRSPYSIQGVIDCYAKSCLANDQRSYCWDIRPGGSLRVGALIKIRISLEEEEEQPPTSSVLVSPCQLLRIYHRHDLSSLRDQLQAEAVKQGVWWCPHLHIDQFCDISS